MCAILDANAVDDVLHGSPETAGYAFRQWLFERGKLVLGGKLSEELNATKFHELLQQLQQAGRVVQISASEIEQVAAKLLAGEQLQSDDPHVVALAQVSGARLLCSNDGKLHRDFKNKKLVDGPRGKIYRTKGPQPKSPRLEARATHTKLLQNRNLCRVTS